VALWLLSGCVRERITDTDIDDTDMSGDTYDIPPGACELSSEVGERGCEVSGAPPAVPVPGSGSYVGWSGMYDNFCISPRSLAAGCDEFIPSYPDPGCPPEDWTGYESSFRRRELDIFGRETVVFDDIVHIDGEALWVKIYYEEGVPVLLNIFRDLPERLWCCDNGDGGISQSLFFGDASLAYPCVADLP